MKHKHIYIFLSAFVGISIAIMPLWIPLILVSVMVISLLFLMPNISIGDSFTARSIFPLFLIIISVWPQYSSYKIGGLPSIDPYRMVYFFAIAIFVFALIVDMYGRKLFSSHIKLFKTPILFISLYYIVTILVSLFSKSPLSSLFLALREVASIFAIFFSALYFIKETKDVDRLIISIVLASLCCSLIVLLQSVTKRNIYYDVLPIASEYAKIAMAERIRDGVYRASGPFDSPLLLVDFLLAAIPFYYCAFVRLKHLFARVFLSVGFCIVVYAIYASGSRAGLLLLLLSVILLMVTLIARGIVNNRRSYFSIYYLFTIVSFIFISLILTLQYLSEFVSGGNKEEATSASVRLTMIKRGVDAILNLDVLGLGLGNSAEYVGVKYQVGTEWIYVLDNLYVSILLDSGIIGLFFFVSFLIWISTKTLKYIFSDANSHEVYISIFIAVLNFSAFKLISSQTQVFPFFYIVCAMLFSQIANEKQYSFNMRLAKV